MSEENKAVKLDEKPKVAKTQPWRAVWPPPESVSTDANGRKGHHRAPDGSSGVYAYNDRDELVGPKKEK